MGRIKRKYGGFLSIQTQYLKHSFIFHTVCSQNIRTSSLNWFKEFNETNEKQKKEEIQEIKEAVIEEKLRKGIDTLFQDQVTYFYKKSKMLYETSTLGAHKSFLAYLQFIKEDNEKN